jgi:hypothetical protein
MEDKYNLVDKHKRLCKLLLKKQSVEIEIEKLLVNNKTRFSYKKFVGDLGEFYFGFHAAKKFKRIKQNVAPNADWDYNVELKTGITSLLGIKDGSIRVEVKTRYDQKGNNHIFGLHPDKFDLLAFVILDKFYKCKHIGIIESSKIIVDRQNRIKYNDYYNTGKVFVLYDEWNQ